MTEQPIRRREWAAVLGCCAATSVAAALWSWQHGAMLNYGDAVAHLHIARRVFDSHLPGLSQLGSVWLPLPHLLLVPFVAVYAWWANGLAGLFVSSLAWLLACAGLYRLVRLWLQPPPASLALAFFAANPNLLYMQTTAMTEPLFLCEMIWTSVLLVEWRTSLEAEDSRQAGRRSAGRRFYWIALVLVAAVFTRYDGWVMALLAWVAVGLMLAHRRGLHSDHFWIAGVIVAVAPVVWFSYNGVTFGDWLDFLRGPYSAKAIELRTALPGGPPHPGWHDPWVSLLFFVKASEMDAAAAAWGNVLFVVSLMATAWAVLTEQRRAFLWSLLLWLPIPFYAYSVAYGSVPIFLPVWWPHSFYNTRYGLELLPAFALGVGFAAHCALAIVREFNPRWTSYATGALLGLIAMNATQMVREQPLVYTEGTKNIESRRAYETEIPPVLRTLLASHPGGMVLMNTSVFPQIVAFSGIPLRQTINEADGELYRVALAAPAGHVAIVLALSGDQIDQAVQAHPEGLTLVRRFAMPGQPSAAIYVSDTPSSP